MISIGQKEVRPHPQLRPQPQAAQGGDDEFELSEEDLAAWAGSLVDDRQKKQGVCGCVAILWVGMKGGKHHFSILFPTESTPPKLRPKPVKQDEVGQKKLHIHRLAHSI